MTRPNITLFQNCTFPAKADGLLGSGHYNERLPGVPLIEMLHWSNSYIFIQLTRLWITWTGWPHRYWWLRRLAPHSY